MLLVTGVSLLLVFSVNRARKYLLVHTHTHRQTYTCVHSFVHTCTQVTCIAPMHEYCTSHKFTLTAPIPVSPHMVLSYPPSFHICMSLLSEWQIWLPATHLLTCRILSHVEIVSESFDLYHHTKQNLLKWFSDLFTLLAPQSCPRQKACSQILCSQITWISVHFLSVSLWNLFKIQLGSFVLFLVFPPFPTLLI